jgi:hypothetical protein
MQVVQTAGTAPRQGSSIFPVIGWMRKRRNDPVKMQNENTLLVMFALVVLMLQQYSRIVACCRISVAIPALKQQNRPKGRFCLKSQVSLF